MDNRNSSAVDIDVDAEVAGMDSVGLVNCDSVVPMRAIDSHVDVNADWTYSMRHRSKLGYSIQPMWMSYYGHEYGIFR